MSGGTAARGLWRGAAVAGGGGRGAVQHVQRASGASRTARCCALPDTIAPSHPALRFKGLFWKAARIGAGVRSGGGSAVGLRLAACSVRVPGSEARSCRLCDLHPANTMPLPPPAGERLSPWVAVACIAMGLSILFY